MHKSYVLISIFLTVFNIVKGTPVRDKYVFNKISVAVEKPTKIKDIIELYAEKPAIIHHKKQQLNVEGNDDEGLNNLDKEKGASEEQQHVKSDKGENETNDEGDRGKNDEKGNSNDGKTENQNEGDIEKHIIDENIEKVDSSGDDSHELHRHVFLNKQLQKYHVEKISNKQENTASNWPLGIIPYNFDTSSFDDILAERVRDAMNFLESVSCVQFKAISGKSPANYTWIHITNPEKQRECSHKPIRKTSGEIVLILGLDCLKRRDILHSLLHGIGFTDEVTHPNRDQYIRIMWENLQAKYQRLFSIIPGQSKVLVEYDPMSIMHFHDRAFSKNGHATIVPLIPGLQIQPSDRLSQLDKMKLRLAFGHECNRRTVDDLFDTCKTVMHKAANGEADDESVSELKASEHPKSKEGEFSSHNRDTGYLGFHKPGPEGRPNVKKFRATISPRRTTRH